MADYKVTDTELTSIANAIRTKGGTSAQLEFPTGFVSAVQAIPTGGGGDTNILYGTTSPTSNVGNNGDIYLQTEDVHWDSELEWGCFPEYYVKSTTQLLSTHSKAFYKTVEGGCVAVEYHQPNGNWYGQILLSTVRDYVKYTANENPTDSVVIDGTTWYISSAGQWLHSADPNATIPLYEGTGNTVNDAPYILKRAFQTYNESASGVINTYAKVSGVWQSLVGTNILDINTGGN